MTLGFAEPDACGARAQYDLDFVDDPVVAIVNPSQQSYFVLRTELAESGYAVRETFRMDQKRAIVRGLDLACRAIDQLAYRPAVVRATMRAPRWWNCQLARLSVALDDRWHVGHWHDWGPGGVCDICGRRAAWLTLGGPEADDLERAGHAPTDPALPLDDEALNLCYWCRLQMPITTDAELAAAIDDARSRSIAWTWRWRSTQPD